MPKVSVIINCYNGEKYLEKTLDSLKKQTYTNFELIFWDNGSTDRSSEIVHSFDDRLRYFHNDKTISLGAARNCAIREAQGDYIAFLDCDDLWEDVKLQEQVNFLEANPEIGLVTSNYKQYNMLSEKIDVINLVKRDQLIDYKDFVCRYNYCLSTFIIRKTALEGLRLIFDGRLEYTEEYDLFVRVAIKWKVYCMNKYLVTYRIHSSMNTIKLRDQLYEEYNIVLSNLEEENGGLSVMDSVIKYHITYMVNFAKSKYLLSCGKTKEVRKLMKPFRRYNIRAYAYYFVALMPNSLAVKIFNRFYKNRI